MNKVNYRRLSNLMLLANLISTLFYSASYPYIYAELMKCVTQGYIGFEQIVSCVSTIIFGTLWNKYSSKLFSYYRQILLLEIIFDIILFTDVIIRNDLKFYFVLNVLIFAIITRNLCCGNIKMRAKVNPTEELRERYDNNANSICSGATILGTALALMFSFNLRTLFVLALIGNTIDNFFYLYIYNQIQKSESENDKSL